MSNSIQDRFGSFKERADAEQEALRAELDGRADIIMARDTDTDPLILKAFAESKDQHLRSATLMNPSTPAEIVEEAIFTGSDEDAIAAGHNPVLDHELRTIAQFRYVDILPLDGKLSKRIRRMSSIIADRY